MGNAMARGGSGCDFVFPLYKMQTTTCDNVALTVNTGSAPASDDGISPIECFSVNTISSSRYLPQLFDKAELLRSVSDSECDDLLKVSLAKSRCMNRRADVSLLVRTGNADETYKTRVSMLEQLGRTESDRVALDKEYGNYVRQINSLYDSERSGAGVRGEFVLDAYTAELDGLIERDDGSANWDQALAKLVVLLQSDMESNFSKYNFTSRRGVGDRAQIHNRLRERRAEFE